MHNKQFSNITIFVVFYFLTAEVHGHVVVDRNSKLNKWYRADAIVKDARLICGFIL